ncbi:hypothetical protein A2926_00305 [Candidatus Giovannonibacteria bacterium RIFCSPLOWO2_01_FULL_44_40]|nr:MAG: hypothetical protein A2926_00305 [Candidatus Giovannonibacteria bacterium RIFCSPLOWO2_01_FULL_44_40]
MGVFGGMIIGSGMFALPYAVSVSGLWASLIAAGFAFFAVMSIHLAYGEIVVNTEERHRLPGYVGAYLGKFAGNLNKAGQIIFFNATLLIYAVLGGVFLSTIFGSPPFWWTLIFFAASALILFFENIEGIGFLNFILTIPMVLAILIISFLAFKGGSVANIPLFGPDPFFAFGIFVFALTGLSVIPDAYDIFRFRNVEEKQPLKKIIALGTIIPIILYAIFIIGALMAVNGPVSQDTISSLEGVLGRRAVILGALVGFLAVFTSFLVLAYDLRQIYRLDAGISKLWAWILSAAVPTALFLLGLTDFIKIISIVGGVFIALDGFFVIFILRKIRKGGISGYKFLPFGPIHQALLILLFAASIVYEIVYQIL